MVMFKKLMSSSGRLLAEMMIVKNVKMLNSYQIHCYVPLLGFFFFGQSVSIEDKSSHKCPLGTPL